MDLPDDQLAEIFAEIREYNESLYLQPGEFTIGDYERSHGLTYDKALKEIMRCVSIGKLEEIGERIHPDSGQMARAFRPVKAGSDD